MKSNNFGEGNITAIILKQAIPLIIAQLAQLLYSIVDRVFIGHIPNTGKSELTGLGICFPIISLIMAFTLLFGLGGTPLFSIAKGAKKNNEAADYLRHSFVLLLGTSLILTIASYLTMRPLLYALGASDVTYFYARKYLTVYLIGTPFLMLGSGMNFYISAQGRPSTAMITTLSGAAVNVVLDPILIFKMGLGIRGAAIATVISQFISFIWVMYFFTFGESEVKLTFKKFVFSAKTALKIISVGITNFIMEATNCAIQIVCNKSLSYYGGDDYVTIMTVINSIRAIMGLAVSGVTSGSQPVLGFNYGAGKFDRVKKGIRVNTLIGVIYTAFAWAMVWIFPHMFISIFSNDQTIIDLGMKYLRIYFMGYIFMSLQFSGQTTFMSLAKTKYAITFSILRKIIIVVPLTLILPLVMKDSISGIFWAEPISNIIGGSASFITMYFTVYRKLQTKRD
ncbi:MAG: MATE family efflux transporter [Clostridiales bacterium]|nr:MATE family efflux transporter [Clostridiales bacterium]